MRSFRHLASLLSHTLTALILIACGGDGPTAPPLVTPTMTATLGDGATATVAQATPQAPTVVITDSHGKHASGITVTFTPDSTSGSVTQTTATTDTGGVASAGAWTLGTHAGPQQLTASATIDGTSLTTKFAATGTADRPSSMSIVSGGAQDGPFGASLVTPMVVMVADKYGNPNSNVLVRFSIDSGAVIGGAIPTGTSGQTSVRVRLPRTTGRAVLTASVDSGPSMQSTFTSRGIRFASFAMFASDACGVSTDGYGYCWGSNNADELVPVGIPAGQKPNPTPQPVPADEKLSSFSLENVGGCILSVTGNARCWGNNSFGEDGNGGTSLAIEALKPVVGNRSFVELHRGALVTCGTTSGGGSFCWGQSHLGEGGAASYFGSSSSTPVAIDGGITFHSYATGWMHTCALDPAGQAYCWGTDLDGRLGVSVGPRACDITTYYNGVPTVTHTTCSPSPVAVNTSARFTTLVANTGSTCGLTAAGDVYCWGNNDFGGLATGDTVASATPAKVANLPTLKELHGGSRTTCGLTAAGDIYCWGMSMYSIGGPPGVCGPISDCQTTPVKLSTGRQFSTIAATEGQICGLSSGIAYCLGSNFGGALGAGSTGSNSTPTATMVAGQTP